tara:strand:- start:1581 stop:2708 length:1128 start_codon:yes stop_codon:yes gene_type:complete
MSNKNILPPGFKDNLSPFTESEHNYTNKIIKIFNSNGYKITKPPLFEYLNNSEEQKKIFVINYKNKKKSLKVRNDITEQISRIATSRFNKFDRPLRLCYYGEVVRNSSSILKPERQFLQVGAECIGEKSFLADVEILSLAFESLKAVGIKDITIDFSNSFLINFISNKDLKSKNKFDFFKYLKRKDIDMSLSLLNNSKKILYVKNLIKCRGELSQNLKLINKLKVNKKISNEIENLIKIIVVLKKKFKDIIFNIDFCDHASQNYYYGNSFTIFAKNVRGEIASGGRYLNKYEKKETGVGFACYMDTIVRASSAKLNKKKIIIPFKTDEKLVKKLIKKNFIILRNFENKSNLEKIAKAYKLNYFFYKNRIKKVKYD